MNVIRGQYANLKRVRVFGLVLVFFPLICPGNNKNNNIKNDKNLSKDLMISSDEWTKNGIQESYAITRVTFV